MRNLRLQVGLGLVVLSIAACAGAVRAGPAAIGTIAFSALAADGDTEILIIRPDGTGLTKVPTHVSIARHPAWSPDGRELAFVDGQERLYVIALDGSGLRLVTRNALFPSWAPDGQRIAFSRVEADQIALYVINADGSGEHKLIDDATFSAWSPDGHRIAFTRAGQIHLIRDDGTGMQVLTDRMSSALLPAWSPDGNRIAFAGYRGGRLDIYTIATSGAGLRKLTDFPNRGATIAGKGYALPVVGGPVISVFPVWSPDGTQIAFSSDLDGEIAIYLMHVDGTGLRKLATGLPNSLAPAWTAASLGRPGQP